LKGNQPKLWEGVALLFAQPVAKLTGARQRSQHGNRHEVRELVVSSELNAWAEWPYLGQVGQLTYTCECRGKVSRETSYIITSLSKEEASPHRLLRLIRGHWGIENRVHWVRDVTFDEDRSQVRCGSGPQVMATLRNCAIGLLRLKGARNIAAARRTLAWHAERALQLVTSRVRITK
jgi:predicted transposase YbfD/YdcC